MSVSMLIKTTSWHLRNVSDSILRDNESRLVLTQARGDRHEEKLGELVACGASTRGNLADMPSFRTCTLTSSRINMLSQYIMSASMRRHNGFVSMLLRRIVAVSAPLVFQDYCPPLRDFPMLGNKVWTDWDC